MFKLLLVEDDDLVRAALTRRLNKLCDVTVVVNGAEALAKAQVEHFDLIVSDVDMPVMNGIEFFKLLKKVRPNVSKAFIFLTGRPEAVAGFGALVLEKPQTTALIEAVKDAIRGFNDSSPP